MSRPIDRSESGKKKRAALRAALGLPQSLLGAASDTPKMSEKERLDIAAFVKHSRVMESAAIEDLVDALSVALDDDQIMQVRRMVPALKRLLARQTQRIDEEPLRRFLS